MRVESQTKTKGSKKITRRGAVMIDKQNERSI